MVGDSQFIVLYLINTSVDNLGSVFSNDIYSSSEKMTCELRKLYRVKLLVEKNTCDRSDYL